MVYIKKNKKIAAKVDDVAASSSSCPRTRSHQAKAPLAVAEESTDQDQKLTDSDQEILTQKKNLKTCKIKGKTSQLKKDLWSSEEEVDESKKKGSKNKKKDLKLISFKYEISDEDHTFKALHKKTGSIEVDLITTKGFDKNNVKNYLLCLVNFINTFIHFEKFQFKVGDKITFIKSIDNDHLPVNAIITCEDIYTVPYSNKKGILNTADENVVKNKPKTSDFESIVKLLFDTNLKKATVPPADETNKTILTSPQIKRKNKEPEDPVELCEGCQYLS